MGYRFTGAVDDFCFVARLQCEVVTAVIMVGVIQLMRQRSPLNAIAGLNDFVT